MDFMPVISSEDLRYLEMAGCDDSVIRHCIAVAEKALAIAERTGRNVDMELVKKGALNHDIGRAVTQTLLHVPEGASIARRLGLEDEVVRIIERHGGAGITEDEAEVLGFPPGEYMPRSPEEVIVAYADNLICGFSERSFESALGSFERTLGSGHPAVERFRRMHELVSSWMDGAGTAGAAEGGKHSP